MIKLFISIPLPEAIKKDLKHLDDDISKCKWTNKNNLHLTLKYIGEVSDEEYYRIRGQLKEVDFPHFSLKLENVGYFPHRKNPQALWAGVPKSRQLCELRHLIEKALVDDNIAPRSHNFHPHITIGRLKKGKYQDVSKFLRKNSLFESSDFNINEFQLISSHPGGDGVHYEIEYVYHLNELVEAA